MALYTGISFPFRKSDTGLPAKAEDEELIKQSLTQLVLTGKGERVMRPDVGSNAYRYIFENNDSALLALVQTEIQQVVSKYEPRVALVGVSVTKGEKNTEEADAAIVITITYVILASRTTGTLSISVNSGA